jgi:8-oxo-dGTP pyrophosphatase MutT (NUDIX family)
MRHREIGALPYRIKKNRIELVLVKTRDGKRWILPKGHTEKRMSHADVAKMEAYEEAGVLGAIDKDNYAEVVMRRGIKRTKLRIYPLKSKKVLNSWPESDERERVVVQSDDALKMITDKPLRKCVKTLLRKVA